MSVVAGSYDKSIFSFVKTTKLSSKVALPRCIPTAVNESPRCSTSWSAFGVVSVLHLGHCNKCVLVSHCFNLHFSNGIRCGASFHLLLCHLLSLFLFLFLFFDEVSLKVFGSFFNQIVKQCTFYSTSVKRVLSPFEMQTQRLRKVKCLAWGNITKLKEGIQIQIPKPMLQFPYLN